jgi:hypothetical protein
MSETADPVRQDLLRTSASRTRAARSRWRTLLEVDGDYTVTRAIRTFF